MMIARDGRWMKRLWFLLRAMFVPFAGMVLSAAACVAPAQTSVLVKGSSRANVRAVREIDDPLLGSHWLLLRDSDHPGAPGRLIWAARMQSDVRVSRPGREAEENSLTIAPPLRPVIRGGDALIVEDETGVAKARLEAVALGPAAVGSTFEARLKIGGTPVKVIALAPGRAKLALQIEVRP